MWPQVEFDPGIHILKVQPFEIFKYIYLLFFLTKELRSKTYLTRLQTLGRFLVGLAVLLALMQSPHMSLFHPLTSSIWLFLTDEQLLSYGH